MVYRLRFDRFNFMTFDIWPDEVEAKLGDMFILDAPVWKDFWQPLNAQFTDMSDNGDVFKIPDITCWFTNDLALNQAAFNSLSEVLAPYGELLPCTCEGIPYWVLHVTYKTGMDAVNLTESERIVEAGGYIDMQSLVFDEKKLGDALIFKTEFSNYRNIYCTDKFKKIIEESELKGLLFSTDLACIHEP